jgi:hypothetical protein
MQRREVITSDSEKEDSAHSEDFEMDAIDLKAHPMKAIFELGKINRALRNYEDDEKLTRLDKRLLKGFYIDDKWELVNSSEEESLKFNYKINVGRVRALLKGTNQ